MPLRSLLKWNVISTRPFPMFMRLRQSSLVSNVRIGSWQTKSDLILPPVHERATLLTLTCSANFTVLATQLISCSVSYQQQQGLSTLKRWWQFLKAKTSLFGSRASGCSMGNSVFLMVNLLVSTKSPSTLSQGLVTLSYVVWLNKLRESRLVPQFICTPQQVYRAWALRASTL
jgi:hypothetical protein